MNKDRAYLIDISQSMRVVVSHMGAATFEAFIEEQIYNWTYSDEQRAKRDWKGPGANPYASLRYMGVSRHKRTEVGLFDTALTEEDFKSTFEGLVEE